MLGAGIFGPGDTSEVLDTTFDEKVSITQRFTDDFDRANGALGGTWKEETNATYDLDKFNIVSNKAVCPSDEGDTTEYAWSYVPRVLQSTIDVSMDLCWDITSVPVVAGALDFYWRVSIVKSDASGWFTEYGVVQMNMYFTSGAVEGPVTYRLSVGQIGNGGGSDTTANVDQASLPTSGQTMRVTLNSSNIMTATWNGLSASLDITGFAGSTDFYVIPEVWADYIDGADTCDPYMSIDNFVSAGPETAWVKPSWWKD